MKQAKVASYFNSRPSARGDKDVMPGLSQYVISIHAPPRGATVRASRSGGNKGFQFTPLREGRHISEDAPKEAVTFQFTPLREGRRDKDSEDGRKRLFQFTPLREGRHNSIKWKKKVNHFNSRPSARGDGERLGKRIFELISIHAPPRGATTLARLFCRTI